MLYTHRRRASLSAEAAGGSAVLPHSPLGAFALGKLLVALASRPFALGVVAPDAAARGHGSRVADAHVGRARAAVPWAADAHARLLLEA